MTKKYLIYILLLVIANLLFSRFDLLWDLTDDQRYTMSDVSQSLVSEVDEDVVVTVFFDGDLPPSFRAYRDYIDHYLSELRRANDRIEVIYKNPMDGTAEERAEVARYLRSYGVTPISRRVSKGESLSQNLIYPYISVHSRKRVVFVDLLEAKQPNQSESEALLSAQINLESKLSQAIRDVSGDASGLVAVVGDDHILLANALNNEKGKIGSYFFFPMNAGQLLAQIDTLDAIIAVVRHDDLDRAELLSIDQCMMSGVPVLWMVDRYGASVDSTGRYGTYTALPQEYNVDDLFFKHGVRIGSDLLSSTDCGAIPQVVGQEGGQAKTELVDYPYHPILKASGDWLANVSQPVLGQFVTTIDTLRVRDGLRRQPILTSSQYSRLSQAPVQLDFESLRYKVGTEAHTAGEQIVGLAVEGGVPSYFNNRLTELDRQQLANRSVPFKRQSAHVREVILAESDAFIPMTNRDGSLFPIGYSFWERREYGGHTLFLKSVMEYLVNGTELVELSRKEIATSTIDVPKWHKNRSKYLALMIAIPLLISMLLLFLVRTLRKRKYAKSS